MKKRKSATIITIYDQIPNIGNRLQNYAVQEVLKKLNFDVTSISYQKSVISGKKKLKYYFQILTRYHLPGDKVYWKLFPKRIAAFNKFNKKFIYTYKIQKIADIKKSDFYVLGSDQVWNPKWYSDCELKKDLFMLTFAEAKQKICFSPSFSVEKLPEQWNNWFKKNLSTFPSLSVREESGAKLIEKLTGKTVSVTIDPTLMLERKEWISIATVPKNVDCNKSYILTYFIGGRSEQVNTDLKKYAKIIGAEVYNLLDMNQPNLYITSPSDFIYLVANSKLVITDSFHACVFSFIFERPFLLYDRINGKNMMSRMDTFFRIFDLERKYIHSGLANNLLECNYNNGYKILNEEKSKTITFLKKSFR